MIIAKKLFGRRNVLLLILLGVCMAVASFCAFALITWYIDGQRTAQEIEEAEPESVEIGDTDKVERINPPDDPSSDYWDFIKLPLIDVDIAKLQATNSDTVGFISVAGTNINYPVVKAKDNDYYLNHSFQKRKNGAGWIFMDYRNNPKYLNQNTVIYGHGRIDNIMFGTLKNILSTAWVNDKNNHVVRYVTEKETMLFQVFSVYAVEAESYYIETSFGSDDEYSEWLNTMIGRSSYDFRTTVDKNDTILTLSTCKDTKGNRIVMQAKLLKKQPKQ